MKKDKSLIVKPSPQEMREVLGPVKNSWLSGCGTSFGSIPNPATSFIGGVPFGFQGTGVSPEQVENFGTTIRNLRWALISNLRQVLSQAFVEIGLVQKICILPVQDGLRGGITIKTQQLDEKEVKKLQTQMDRDDDFGTAGWAAVWERLYGGGGILIIVDDQDPESEFDIEALSEGTKVEFRDADMWELFSNIQNMNEYDTETQLYDFDYYQYYSETVHRSRVMPLKGVKAPSFVRPRLRGWGVSVVEILVRSLNQYLKATDLGFEVLDEFKLDIFKIKNLVDVMLSPDGMQKVQMMIGQLNRQKNYQNAMVIDAEDDFDHKQLSFAGLAEVMEGIRMQVAADMGIPIIKLFGQSVSKGLGNSAQDEMENYNSMVEAEVRKKLKWHMLRMAEIRAKVMYGFVPDDMEIEFQPLRELSAKDQEEVKKAKFDRLATSKAANEITTEEFRDACNKGKLFDIVLDTSDAALASLEEEMQADLEAEASLDDKNDDGKEGGTNKADSKKTMNAVSPFTTAQRMGRLRSSLLANSPAFDRASYGADGGDEWIGDDHRELFENPGSVDEGLWSKAKDASEKAFGKENWKFVTWWYKKQGGKF